MDKINRFFFHTRPGQLIIAGSVIIACVILYFHKPAEDDKYPSCLIYASTGLHCPGCGGIRGTHELLHGHLGQALDYNILSTTLLLFLGYMFLATQANRILKTRIPIPRHSPRLITAYLILVGVFVILRNIPVEPLSWLAPNISPFYPEHNRW
jgi:hypothetical protein